MLSEIERNVFDYIETHRDETLRFLQKLIRIDTQVPPGHNYASICELISDRLHTLGFETRIHEASEKYMKLSGAEYMGLEGSRSNLIAHKEGVESGISLHISAHTDCAAIQEEGWTFDPLGGKITDDTDFGKSDLG